MRMMMAHMEKQRLKLDAQDLELANLRTQLLQSIKCQQDLAAQVTELRKDLAMGSNPLMQPQKQEERSRIAGMFSRGKNRDGAHNKNPPDNNSTIRDMENYTRKMGEQNLQRVNNLASTLAKENPALNSRANEFVEESGFDRDKILQTMVDQMSKEEKVSVAAADTAEKAPSSAASQSVNQTRHGIDAANYPPVVAKKNAPRPYRGF